MSLRGRRRHSTSRNHGYYDILLDQDDDDTINYRSHQ